jgi:hypothetical protein
MDTNKIIRRKSKGIHEEAKGRTFNFLVTISIAFKHIKHGQGSDQIASVRVGKWEGETNQILHSLQVCGL